MYLFKVADNRTRTTSDVPATETETIRDIFTKASAQGVEFNADGLLQINGRTVPAGDIDKQLSEFSDYITAGRVNMISSIVKQTGN